MSDGKWSPEPWRYDEDESPWPGGALVFDLNGIMLFNVSAADARRIVACVNACQGLNTEALESGALGKALDSLVEVVARRKSVCDDNPFARFEGTDGRYARADAALRSLGKLKP